MKIAGRTPKELLWPSSAQYRLTDRSLLVVGVFAAAVILAVVVSLISGLVNGPHVRSPAQTNIPGTTVPPVVITLTPSQSATIPTHQP